MSNNNRTRNFREPIGNDPDESTTEAYPNITNSLSGPNLNIAPPNQSMDLDASAAMASVLECMTLQQSTYHIPQFDGKNPPLKEFLQDIANDAVYIMESTELAFIKVVLSKVKGVARKSIRDKRFNWVNDLMAHLKKCFAPSRKYQWYFHIEERLRQTERLRSSASSYHIMRQNEKIPERAIT